MCDNEINYAQCNWCGDEACYGTCFQGSGRYNRVTNGIHTKRVQVLPSVQTVPAGAGVRTGSESDERPAPALPSVQTDVPAFKKARSRDSQACGHIMALPSFYPYGDMGGI